MTMLIHAMVCYGIFWSGQLEQQEMMMMMACKITKTPFR